MADIRFNRIAVSIFDTVPLEWYFTVSSVMAKATIYCDVYGLWKRIGTNEILKTAEFLQTLYNDDPSKLTSLLSYIINDLPNHFIDCYRIHPASFQVGYSMDYKKQRIIEDLSWFFRELETVGIVWDGKGFHSAVGTTKLDVEIKSSLESMLSDLGKEYLARYTGAIEALMSGNPDNLSQSISSIRELLTSILHLLTMNDKFTGDELAGGQPTRKARIKHILSKSKGLGAEAELAEAMANTLDKTYDALSKGYHITAKKDWDNILYVFKSTEYLIYYILINK